MKSVDLMSLWKAVCSVLLCFSVRKRTFLRIAGKVFLSQKIFLSLMVDIFSLTERTEFTELFGAQFRAHRTPPAYREHRALLPKMAVRFCEIG